MDNPINPLGTTPPIGTPTTPPGPTGPLTPQTLGGGSSTLTSSIVPDDAQVGVSTIPIQEGRFNYNEYLRSTLPVIAELRDKLNEAGAFFDDIKELHESIGLEISGILGLSSAFEKAFQDEQDLINKMNQETTAINNLKNTNINPGLVEDAIKTVDVNLAIFVFNICVGIGNDVGVCFDDNLKTPLETYNAYATTRNAQITAYNNAVNNYNNVLIPQNNATRAQLNVERAALGIPPITASQDTVDTFPPLPILAVPTGQISALPSRIDEAIEDLILEPIISVINQLVELFSPTVTVIVIALSSFDFKLELLLASIDLDQFFLRGEGDIASPDAFIEEQADVFFEPTTPAKGAGTASGGAILGLQSVSFERELSRSAFDIASQELRRPLPPELASATELFFLGLLGQTGVLSGLPAASLISNRLGVISSAGGPAGKAAIGLSFINRIQDLASSDIVPKGIEKFAEKTLGPNAEPKIINALTGGVRLSLLRFALAEAALSIGLPGLPTQVLGQVQGISKENVIAASAQSINLFERLQNPFTTARVKQGVAERLVSPTGFTTEEAQAIANNAVNNALARDDVQTASQFQTALEEELIAQGVDETTARASANEALDIVKGEQDTTSINTVLIREDVLSTSLENVLEGRGFSAEDIQAFVQGTVGDITAQGGATTDSAVRGQIQQAALAAGFGPKLALDLAEGAVIDVGGPGTDNPLAGLGANEIIEPNVLREQIVSHVSHATSPELGKELADEIGERFAQSLLDKEDPNSVVNLYEEEIRRSEEAGTGNPFEGNIGNLQANIHISHDTKAMLKADISPAESMMNSLMPEGGFGQTDMPITMPKAV